MTYVPATYPILETERLILRGPIPEDFPAVSEFLASDRAKFVGGPINEEFRRFISFTSSIGHWAMCGHGFFTATLKDGSIVGRIAIINPIDWPEPEIGWHIYEGFEGKGYAYEGALAVRQWAAEELGFNSLISIIVPENTRSIKLAERLGAVFEGETTVRDHFCHIYRHPKIEVSQ